ncbi:MAG: NepR family anti-sigma factor [Sphingomonadales bacterium]
MRSKRKKKPVETPEIGQALRSIYDRTLNESIPDEMLDLLGKLG